MSNPYRVSRSRVRDILQGIMSCILGSSSLSGPAYVSDHLIKPIVQIPLHDRHKRQQYSEVFPPFADTPWSFGDSLRPTVRQHPVRCLQTNSRPDTPSQSSLQHHAPSSFIIPLLLDPSSFPSSEPVSQGYETAGLEGESVDGSAAVDVIRERRE